jgi:hypothetical protein
LTVSWFSKARRVNNPEAVAATVSALREAHGDNVARAFLADGVTLAALVDAVFSVPIKNSVAVRTIARALESGDFVISPDVGPLWHVRYVYSHPGSMTVVDIVVLTPERTFTSTEISLQLRG